MKRYGAGRVAIIAFAAAAVVIAAVFGGGAAFGNSSGSMKLTAYFAQTIGLYEGSTVRILGVPVGKITKIQPQGTRVKVVMEYDGSHPVPANAGAVIIPPSIVSDRYVELTPAYTGGAKLADNATIPESRTAIPLELDQIFGNINQLNEALGPNGANKNGALSRLVDVGAANLQGNGDKLHTALQNFSQAISTLSGHKGDLFGTLTNLQKFTTNLASHDTDVRKLNADLAQVSTILAGNRQELDAALRNLAVALGQIGSFVRDNRSTLTTDVKQLTDITNILVNRQRDLTEILDDAPLGLQNLTLAYNATYHTLDSRGDFENAFGSPGNPTNPACYLYTAVTHQPCPNLGLPSALPTALSPSQEIMQLLGVGQ